ncbi:hypothetical protein [Fimbriiglobus ruber]|uniref:Uncharacterized protein n=1 Tax=Fimbriiglobus ruber TaxID=1908690 RepID=A0A225DW64_9BACT|nr:hypothetical protein [Fimbriiglobus ruber]OWK45780.1 hypothetical protein FRUB_02111 [Fimbriiglobus ruber]
MRWPWSRRGDGRTIFEFFDGIRTRRVDPTVVGEALEAELGPGCGRDLLRLLTQDATAIPGVVDTTGHAAAQTGAVNKIAAAVGRAFGAGEFKDLGGGRSEGLTRGERVALLCVYLDYLGGLAAKARPFTPSPSPTGASRRA